MIADLRSLEREKYALREFIAALSTESVRLNMALHWAENYAASFKAGLSKIFGLEQGRTSGIASWPIGTRTRNTIRRQPRSRSRTRSMALARSLVTTNPRRKSRKPP